MRPGGCAGVNQDAVNKQTGSNIRRSRLIRLPGNKHPVITTPIATVWVIIAICHRRHTGTAMGLYRRASIAGIMRVPVTSPDLTTDQEKSPAEVTAIIDQMSYFFITVAKMIIYPDDRSLAIRKPA